MFNAALISAFPLIPLPIKEAIREQETARKALKRFH